MKLRKLQEKDAPLMLEWMHDESVTHDLRTKFMSKTIDDCKKFIANSITADNINYAITEDGDEYLGTVSLKHIKNGNAEFAITIRKCAMGKGIAAKAMAEIIRIAFEDMGLKKVFWCVSPENKRAVRFYDKNGFCRDRSCVNIISDDYTQEEISQYIWYVEKA